MTSDLQVPSSREILSILVEGDGHDSVGGVERLLHPVAMVNVYIYIEHPLVVPEDGGREEER